MTDEEYSVAQQRVDHETAIKLLESAFGNTYHAYNDETLLDLNRSQGEARSLLGKLIREHPVLLDWYPDGEPDKTLRRRIISAKLEDLIPLAEPGPMQEAKGDEAAETVVVKMPNDQTFAPRQAENKKPTVPTVAVQIELGAGAPAEPSKPQPITANTPRDQWLSAIAQEVLKNRAAESSNPIPAEVFFKITVDSEDKALDILHSEFPKPENQTEDDYKEFLAAYSRIEPDGNNQFTLRIAELKADDDLIKHLTDGGFALDTDYNSFYRGYVLRHAFQQVGHAGAIEIDDALHGHIQHVDFDYGKKELQVKLISGEKNTESTVTITKDKFSASNSEDGAIMALVASAKAAGWPSYKITAEGDDLLGTAMAFIQNNLELDVSTQKKLLDTINGGLSKNEKLADYAAIKAWVKQPTSQPAQAAGTTPSSP